MALNGFQASLVLFGLVTAVLLASSFIGRTNGAGTAPLWASGIEVFDASGTTVVRIDSDNDCNGRIMIYNADGSLHPSRPAPGSLESKRWTPPART